MKYILSKVELVNKPLNISEYWSTVELVNIYKFYGRALFSLMFSGFFTYSTLESL